MTVAFACSCELRVVVNLSNNFSLSVVEPLTKRGRSCFDQLQPLRI